MAWFLGRWRLALALLLICSTAFASPISFRFMMSSGSIVSGSAPIAPTVYMAVAHTNSPRVTIYNVTAGYTTLTTPTTLPAGNATGVAFNSSNTLLAVAHATTPFITVYNFPALSKLSNPSTLPKSTGSGVAFSPDGSLMAVCSSNSSSVNLTVYNMPAFTLKSQFQAGPALANCNDVAFSPDGNFLGVATDDEFPAAGGGVYSVPSLTPVTNSIAVVNLEGVAFNAATNISATRIAYAHSANGSARFTVQPIGASTPDTVSAQPGGTGNYVSFFGSSVLAVANSSTPFITVYDGACNGGGSMATCTGAATWTLRSAPGTVPVASVLGVAWSPDGSILGTVGGTTPFVKTYTMPGYINQTNPATLPTGAAMGVAFTH